MDQPTGAKKGGDHLPPAEGIRMRDRSLDNHLSSSLQML